MKNIPETYEGSSSSILRTRKPIIDVVIKFGVVHDVVDIPKGYTVRVWDMDTDGADPEKLVASPYEDYAGNRKAKLEYWV